MRRSASAVSGDNKCLRELGRRPSTLPLLLTEEDFRAEKMSFREAIYGAWKSGWSWFSKWVWIFESESNQDLFRRVADVSSEATTLTAAKAITSTSLAFSRLYRCFECGGLKMSGVQLFMGACPKDVMLALTEAVVYRPPRSAVVLGKSRASRVK